MADSFSSQINRLSKDLSKEIRRLEKELSEKKALLKSLGGIAGKPAGKRRGRKPGTKMKKRAAKVVGRRGRPPKKKRGRQALSNRDKVLKVMGGLGKEVRFSHVVKAVKDKYPGFGGKNAPHAVHQILNKDPNFQKLSKGMYRIVSGK